MLSITDIRDFIDLDIETVQAVATATQLSPPEAIHLARQLLASENGILILHHMFRDQLAEARSHHQPSREEALHQSYRYFARKYPLPQLS